MSARFTITTTNDSHEQDIEALADIQHTANLVKGQLSVEYDVDVVPEDTSASDDAAAVQAAADEAAAEAARVQADADAQAAADTALANQLADPSSAESIAAATTPADAAV